MEISYLLTSLGLSSSVLSYFRTISGTRSKPFVWLRFLVPIPFKSACPGLGPEVG